MAFLHVRQAATCAECLAAGKDYCIADNRSLHLGSESALKAEQLQLQLQLLVPKRLSLSVGIPMGVFQGTDDAERLRFKL